MKLCYSIEISDLLRYYCGANTVAPKRCKMLINFQVYGRKVIIELLKKYIGNKNDSKQF